MCTCVCVHVRVCVWNSLAGMFLFVSVVFVTKYRLYDCMDDLLKVEVAVPYMAALLTEVFTGRPEICLKVTEDQVERVFQLMVNSGEEGRAGQGQAELIATLQAMTKV